MAKRLRTFIIGLAVVALATCGPPATPPEVPDDDADQPETGELSFATEKDGPPEPPEPYVGPWKAKGEMPESLVKAEKKFKKKNYKQALQSYQKFVSADAKSYWVPYANFQMTRCHYQLSEYDEALDVFNAFIESKPGLLWEARAKLKLSHLYHGLPTSGYERDERVYYNYEHHEGEYRYMWEENRDLAIKMLEEARLAYIALLEAPDDLKGLSDGDDLRLEAVDTDFLMVRDVDNRYWEKYDPCPPSEAGDPPRADATFDPEWSAREKMLFLLEEIPRFNEGRDDTHPAAWATFKKALFLQRYPECAPAEWQKKMQKKREAYESEMREKWEDTHGKSAADMPYEDVIEDLKDPGFVAPYWSPGPDLDPLMLVESILEKFPGDRREQLYEATRGRILEGRNEYQEAEKIYEAFLEAHPKSPWSGDVKSSLWGMKQTSLNAWMQEFTYDGGEGRLDISTRNVKTVKVKIHAIDLPKELLKKANLQDPHSRFTDLRRIYGDDFKDIAKKLKKKVWEKQYETKDQGDYRNVHGYLDLPDLDAGFYLVHLSSGKQDMVRPWLRTDVIIVGKSVKDEFRYVVTESATGSPLKDFPITVKEVYERREDNWGWKYEVKIAKGKTDSQGRYNHKIVKGDDISYTRVMALAHKGKRMAMTSDYSGPYWHGSDTGMTYRIFTVTDRPVYRPGDEIQFKHIIRAYEKGRNEHVKGLKVRMEVTNPKGEKIFEKTVKASDFGNAWGKVEVGEEAPLGSYHARAYVEGHEYRSYQSSGSYFRVEEYKKPEFEVQVLPSQSIATAGDEVEARIKATYYFGAPVTEAKVSYKIFRSIFNHSYVPPNRWDWLYGKGFGIIAFNAYGYGEDLIDEGEGLTDDLGELMVKLPQIEDDLAHDFKYRVVAEVTDLSRRVINGSGNLKVTRAPYYSYVMPTQGFYTKGDNVEVELLAMTPDNEPVAAKGTLEIAKLEYPVAEKVEEKVVEAKKISLDAAGRAFHTFKVKKEGQYRFRYTSTHDGSKEVVGERIVNVAGEKLSAKHFKFDKVEVTSEKRTYTRGETIKLFVQSPWKDATLWVTYEGGDEVFHDEVYQPKGVGMVLEVKATDQLHPNFFVRVTAVRDGSVYTISREMFIPPGEEILEVEITADKAEYKPRAKGKFDVKVKDSEGKPIKGEFSLSVFDESVLYIQSETTGDLRSYYYGNRRYNDVREFHSGQIWLPSWSRDQIKWPHFEIMGLPDASGWFAESYYDRALYYTCPSCEGKVSSPWRFDLPDEKAKNIHGTGGGWGPMGGDLEADEAEAMPESTANMPVMVQSKAVYMNGGGGGMDASGVFGAAEKSGGKKGKTEEALAMNFEDIGDANDVDQPPGADAGFVRDNFVDTALWVPDVVTGKNGKASVDIEWPDNLTTWAVRVFGIDGKARVGLAKTSVITTKKLVARIETPRFMIEGDSITLAAVVNNDYPEKREVELTLELEGGVEYGETKKAKITVPAGKDARYDFHVRAVEASQVKVKLTAVTHDDSDALLKKLEVMEWGSDKMVSRQAAMRAPGKMTLKLDLPDERRKDTTEFVLALDPSVAGVVLQSMPYLIHYPYGCVEQTMSRFLPAAMVARTLKDLGIKLEEIPELADKATLADPTGKPHGKPQTWMNAPIYKDEELEKIIKIGLKRIYSFQHSDGGWAWWHSGPSDPYMSAYVLSGLYEAKSAGYAVNGSVLDSGMKFLSRKYKKMRKDIEKKKGWHDVPLHRRHLMTYMAYVLSLDGRVKFDDVDGLYEHREALTHYGRSLLALTLDNVGEKDKAKLAVENLADVAWADDANGTASFKFEAKQWWRWYNNRIETVAWALRAFTQIDPKHKLGSQFARWLTNNREGNRWFSTRDTALAVLALTDYMREHDEFNPDYEATVKVNGKKVLTYHQTKKNIFAGKGRVTLRGDQIKGKKLEVVVETKGEGAIYASGFLSYFTKEKVIEGAGNEIFIDRHYYKLEEVKKKVKTWYGEVTKIDYKRHELEPGDAVKSGDLVEVKIMIEAKNDYEYLVFEDYKPAGFEPLALKSGGLYQHGTWINRELRDEKVVNFLYSLEQGKQAITYKLRAEIPGEFRVLPHKGYAMYAPRVKAISDSWTISVNP